MQHALSPVERIHALGRFSGKPGLHRMRALCNALGNPQDQLKFIHLAGTNGKGSTATMLASALEKSGYRTGLYTSPYLITFHERIRINGSMISDNDLSQLFQTVQDAANRISLPAGEHIGEFEFVTAMAFLYFLEQACDIVVLECGLGGEYDATNIIAPPEAAIITSISLDHIGVLGHTVEEIARTKAGIFKPGSIHIAACDQSPQIYKVLTEQAPDLLVPSSAQAITCELTGSKFYWENKPYEIRLIGNYQIENAVTSIFALQQMSLRGWQIPDAAIRAGLRRAYIPGRFQIIDSCPRIIIDGSHNPDGICRLSETVKSFHFTGSVHVILGMCKDKLLQEAVQEFTFPVKKFYLTPLQNERTADCQVLADLLQNRFNEIEICKDCADALSQAQTESADNDLILLCGSLYLAGEAEQILAHDIKM